MAHLSLRRCARSYGRILATFVLVPLLMMGPTGLALAGEEGAATSALTIETDPIGAVVYVDGVERGVTPLSLEDVAPGEHRLTMHKESYLENTRVVTLDPGEQEHVRVNLTEAVGDARYSVQIGGSSDDGGGANWPLILGVAGGGAAAAVLLLAGGNDPPVAGSISASPTTGLASVTSFRFSASGASDPDGDSLSFQWDFGDGNTGSGQNVTHTYASAGSFSVMLTVSDGEDSATASPTSVTVRSLSGTWRGTIAGFINATLNINQSGTTLSGSYQDQDGPGTIRGTINSQDSVSITVNQPPFNPYELRGSISSDFNQIRGQVFGSGFTGEPFLLSRS